MPSRNCSPDGPIVCTHCKLGIRKGLHTNSKSFFNRRQLELSREFFVVKSGLLYQTAKINSCKWEDIHEDDGGLNSMHGLVFSAVHHEFLEDVPWLPFTSTSSS
ncbi:hypothetical protein GOP47_0016580 [Adiantum capillus-veneris]|uniref:Uncharacterized protein n=1 Tax=Adiantum capillus-veneris TaxID=13818 RepID=A0A9D4UI31_ADICA|nr:hypothetical protein GOP47_0016580 [Adiantum capillus-veneris]